MDQAFSHMRGAIAMDENRFGKDAIRNMLDLISIIPENALYRLIGYVKKSASPISEGDRSAIISGAIQLVGDSNKAGGDYKHAMQAAYLLWHLAECAPGADNGEKEGLS